MKLILRNLRGFLLHHTGFFVLMLCCVLSSAVIMLFSFGLYQNYRLEREEYTAAQLEMQLDCSGVTKAELQAVVELISSSTHENINLIAAEVRDGAFWTGEWKHELFTRFVYRSGSYHAYAEIEDNMLRHGDVQNGRFYTDTEYQSGARVMIVSQDEMYARLLEAEPELANAEVIEMPDVTEPIEAFYPFSLCGEQFTPIMRLKEGSPDVPFPAIPGQAQITHVYILFSVPPKPVQVREIYTAVQQVCGDRVKLPDYVPADEEDYTLYSTVMLIAVLIACAAAVNIVVLYDYILRKIHRHAAVLRSRGGFVRSDENRSGISASIRYFRQSFPAGCYIAAQLRDPV